MLKPENPSALYFALFNEMGIINQLTIAVLESNLPHGLLEPHFAVLNHLVRVGDGRTPLQMARAFQVPKTTIGHRVGVLAKHGLVRVDANPVDGRSKCVFLTEGGRALREDVVNGFGDVIERWKDTIEPDEVADLLPRLTRIREFLDADRDMKSEN